MGREKEELVQYFNHLIHIDICACTPALTYTMEMKFSSLAFFLRIKKNLDKLEGGEKRLLKITKTSKQNNKEYIQRNYFQLYLTFEKLVHLIKFQALYREGFFL